MIFFFYDLFIFLPFLSFNSHYFLLCLSLIWNYVLYNSLLDRCSYPIWRKLCSILYHMRFVFFNIISQPNSLQSDRSPIPCSMYRNVLVLIDLRTKLLKIGYPIFRPFYFDIWCIGVVLNLMLKKTNLNLHIL